jgi:hypothetical protein
MVATGQAVLKSRVSTASYGIVCDIEYNKKTHGKLADLEVEEDPLDGRKWVKDQIDWVIKKVCREVP